MPDGAFNGWRPDPQVFLDALRPWGLKQTGKDEFRARCPAHDGGDQNLAVSREGDTILTHCHSHGCDFQLIRRALGLGTRPSLRAVEGSRREPNNRFEYHGVDGRPLVAVCRQDGADGKRIWREPKGAKSPHGGWPLYRVGSLLADPGAPILLVEGEATVDAAQGLLEPEFQVTTTIGGAGKAAQSNFAVVRGREVTVWPDADEPGRKHGDDLAGLCVKAGAASVRVVDTAGLPHGWDLADLEPPGFSIPRALENASGTHRDARDAYTEGLGFTSADDLLDEPEEAIEWQLEDRLPGGGLSMIVGKPKTGKSTWARALAVATAQGEPFMGRFTRQGPVLYVALQEIRADVRDHFRSMGLRYGDPLHTAVIWRAPEDCMERLKLDIARVKPVLVIMDTLKNFMRGIDDITDYDGVTRALEPVLELARTTGAHVLMVHHSPKAVSEDIGDNAFGSTALFGTADTLLVLQRKPDGTRVMESQQRYGREMAPTILDMDERTGCITEAGTKAAADHADVEQAVLDTLAASDTPMSGRQVEKVAGRRAQDVRAALQRLHRNGLVECEPHGRARLYQIRREP